MRAVCAVCGLQKDEPRSVPRFETLPSQPGFRRRTTDGGASRESTEPARNTTPLNAERYANTLVESRTKSVPAGVSICTARNQRRRLVTLPEDVRKRPLTLRHGARERGRSGPSGEVRPRLIRARRATARRTELHEFRQHGSAIWVGTGEADTPVLTEKLRLRGCCRRIGSQELVAERLESQRAARRQPTARAAADQQLLPSGSAWPSVPRCSAAATSRKREREVRACTQRGGEYRV